MEQMHGVILGLKRFCSRLGLHVTARKPPQKSDPNVPVEELDGLDQDTELGCKSYAVRHDLLHLKWREALSFLAMKYSFTEDKCKNWHELIVSLLWMAEKQFQMSLECCLSWMEIWQILIWSSMYCHSLLSYLQLFTQIHERFEYNKRLNFMRSRT